MSEPDGPIVSPDWVATRHEDLTIVDVRDPWEYDGIGHIPGAVNIPFDTYRSTDPTDEGHLPGPDRFAEVLGEAGIDSTDTIVAYDDEHGVFAARFVVTALLYGHDQVYLLDGDYSAWSRSHETTTEPTHVTPTTYDATIPPDRPLVDADAVLAAVTDPDTVLVDTRTVEEFHEGHIEGAVNFDWRELVDPNTRGFKPPDELERILASYGVTLDKRIILYCNTARRISHTYLALRHIGFENVGFYEGSLTDWNERRLPLTQD